MDIEVYNKLKRWSGELDEVFTFPDLKVILGERTESALYKRLLNLIKSGLIVKVKRGIYATPEASLISISNRICPGAYVSTGTVLAKKAIIGSVPVQKVQAVKVGRPRTYRFKLGVIEHLSISPKLYFGFDSVDGVMYANTEKAFLDVCYFYYKRKKFSFDPDTDVNMEFLDKRLISSYLEKYDKRFVSFYTKIWGEL